MKLTNRKDLTMAILTPLAIDIASKCFIEALNDNVINDSISLGFVWPSENNTRLEISFSININEMSKHLYGKFFWGDESGRLFGSMNLKATYEHCFFDEKDKGWDITNSATYIVPRIDTGHYLSLIEVLPPSKNNSDNKRVDLNHNQELDIICAYLFDLGEDGVRGLARSVLDAYHQR